MLKSSFWLVLLTVVISLTSFINQVIIAHFFGASANMDLYVAISSLPLLFGAILSTSLSYSLTPHLIKKQIQLSQIDYSQYLISLLKQILKYSLVLILIISLICALFYDKLYPTFRFTDLKIVYSIQLFSWLSTLFGIITTVLTCFYNARKKFIFPLTLSFLPYIGSIIVTTLFVSVLGVTAVAIGMFIGSCISCLILFNFAKLNFIFKIANPIEINSQIIFLKNIPLVIIAMLCFTVYQSIDSFWVPRIGTSMLSYIGYCQRIIIAVGSLVITGPSTVLIPRLTKALLEERDEDFYNDIVSLIFMVFSLASLFALIGTKLSKPIINILFQRGAFNVHDTLMVSNLLPFMFIGMVFMICVVLLFRVLFIQEMFKSCALIGIIATLNYFLFSGIAINFRHINAIGVAYILTWIISFSISIHMIFKNRRKIFFNKYLYETIGKLILLLIVTNFCLSAIISIFDYTINETLLTNILKTLTVSFFGILIFVSLSTKLLVIKEIKILLDSIIKIIKR